MSFAPGEGRQRHYASTVACLAHVVLYRFKALGLLDAEGRAIRGGLQGRGRLAAQRHDTPVIKGRACPECGAHAVIRKDGCEQCTACGYLGACG